MEKRAEKLKRELEQILGREKVKLDFPTRISYSRDIYPLGYLELRQGEIKNLPVAICYPEDVKEVAELVRWAGENEISLIPFGGGSGVLGACVPVDDGVVVDLKRMSRIRKVNPINHTCEAEAGIIGEVLERKLNQKGFTLGHFPASMYCSTLGGWIATRSAGQLSARYGKIEDMVIALEGVLADGSIFRTRSSPRSATGPDLDQVLIGSEGTLAIITSAVLTIHPLPKARFYRGWKFPDVASGLDAMRRLTQKDIAPSLLRLYDPLDTKFNAEKLGVPSAGCLLIAGYEGENKELVQLGAELGWRLLKKLDAEDLAEEPAKRWLEHRYSVSYHQSRILSQPNTLIDTIEVSVIWSRALELYQLVMDRVKSLALTMAHFSHSWREGVCIYFSFLFSDPSPQGLKEKHKKTWEQVMSACLELGASISHHHGIGLHRIEWLKKELGEGHKILSRIKNEIDPKGILNPSKLGFMKEKG